MAKGLRILVVEDNAALARNVVDYLEQHDHQVDYAADGALALDLALRNHYDVVVLDLTLPILDGWQVCRELRAQALRHVPVLMLTARDTLDDKLQGFDAGADDYLTKPFALEEVHVRCKVLSRRHLLNKDVRLTLGDLVIDRKTQQVTREGKPVALHQLSYRILVLLAEAWPGVVTRSELMARLWGDEPPDSDALRSHIYLLRQSLDKPFAKPMLVTVHGVGFKLEQPS